MTDPLPTSVRAIHWGGYRARYVAGLTMILCGAAATTLTTTFSIWFLAIGPGVQLLGWLLMPGALWRRLMVLIPCLGAGIVLLGGPDFAGAFVALLAGWLFVRGRRRIAYLALLLPIIASILIKTSLGEYSQNWVALLVGTSAGVAGAWIAARLAARTTAADVTAAATAAATEPAATTEPEPAATPTASNEAADRPIE